MTLGIGSAVDPDRLVGQRWFAAPRAAPTAAVVEEWFALGGDTGLAILRIDVAAGSSLRFTLPVGAASADPLTDAFPGPWPALAALAARGGTITGEGGGCLIGRPPKISSRTVGR